MSRRVIPLVCFVSALVVASLVLARPKASAWAAPKATFMASKTCKDCHFRQGHTWKRTAHAKALALLKPGQRVEAKKKAGLKPDVDYTKDASCLKCHVTGYGETGGYPALKETWSEAEKARAANNAGIGCESCHGAGSLFVPYKRQHRDYARAEVVKRGLHTPITAENCTGCHNKDNPSAGEDYTFDFDRSKGASAIHQHTPLGNH